MTRPPGLLLLHGSGDTGECWGPFVARIRTHEGMADLVVATPDAPAHGGRRSQPGQTIAWPDLVADAASHAEALVARTGGPIVVAGHSMGAMTALGVAADRPDLIAATFLEDPPFGAPLTPEGHAPPPPQPVDVTPFREWFADLQARPLDEVIAIARSEHPIWDEGEYEPWARAKQAVDVAAFGEPVVFVHADTDRIVREARTPVVVAAGEPELGGMLSAEAGRDLAGLPGWTLRRLPVGHDVRRDAPEATVDLLVGLIRAVAG